MSFADMLTSPCGSHARRAQPRQTCQMRENCVSCGDTKRLCEINCMLPVYRPGKIRHLEPNSLFLIQYLLASLTVLDLVRETDNPARFPSLDIHPTSHIFPVVRQLDEILAWPSNAPETYNNMDTCLVDCKVNPSI